MTKVQGWIIIVLLAIIAVNSFGYVFPDRDPVQPEKISVCSDTDFDQPAC